MNSETRQRSTSAFTALGKADNALDIIFTTQLSLLETQERIHSRDTNNACAHKLHRRVIEMIVLDWQPFSVVKVMGFIQLLDLNM